MASPWSGHLVTDPQTSQMRPLNSQDGLMSAGPASAQMLSKSKEKKKPITQVHFSQKHFIKENMGWLNCIILPMTTPPESAYVLEMKESRKKVV